MTNLPQTKGFHLPVDPKDSTVLTIEIPLGSTLTKEVDIIQVVTNALQGLGTVDWAGEVHGPRATQLTPMLHKRMPKIWNRGKALFKVTP